MKKMRVAGFFMFICLLGFTNVQAGEYVRTPNAAISGHNVKHLKNVSVQDCMNACDREPWCKSFDYYKRDRACDLSDKNASDVGGLKRNYSGNPYDHYAKKSDSAVSQQRANSGTRYGYTRTPDAAISGHNVRHIKGSVQACMNACDREPWCKSFDYYKRDNGCDLSDKSAADVGGLKKNYSGNPYDHYQKELP